MNLQNPQQKKMMINWGLAIFLVSQFMTALWWASSITTELKHQSELISKTLSVQDGQNLQIQIDKNSEAIIEIKNLLIRIDDKIDDLGDN